MTFNGSSPMFKTTIEILTSYDPTEIEIDALAREAMDGDAYCVRQDVTQVFVHHLAAQTDDADGVADFFNLPEQVGPTVKAAFRTDDGAHAFDFDVSDFLATLTDDDLMDLRNCEWGGDYPADDAYYWYADKIDSPASRAAAAHLEAGSGQIGFEVHIDVDAAEAWVRADRPAVALSEAEEN